ncbi:hypothetical protein M413DRAFT_440507 [Hebeloma cylindrosporum]|uniref:PHP domain-like protein n=1 Tax=Hebeloma cylindrosporum TaxID=76867 RepID=A0A0C3CSP8_HEBCY|nr:hypothetical protein M413DRAFT_440507 [Hebeloma cylindrosporum h7]
MFFDLNIPIKKSPARLNTSKKSKLPETTTTWTTAEIADIERRVDVLVHLGYTVLAFSQTVNKKIDPKTHVNFLDNLISQLRTRSGIVYLKRLNIILDQDSEKGFGLVNASVSLFNAYDLIALVPTTHNTFSSACLTHSLPSQLTAHIISLPLTLPRLPYHMKHTLIRTAIKNGAVFEINYVGALGGENDSMLVEADAAENGPNAKRNWWASSRELVRVTKGRSIVVSGGIVNEADLRAPRDVANLISMLGLAQDAAHDASSKTPKSLIIRAKTRQTHRAVLSEPAVVFPANSDLAESSNPIEKLDMEDVVTADSPQPQKRQREDSGPSKKKKRKQNREDTQLVA